MGRGRRTEFEMRPATLVSLRVLILASVITACQGRYGSRCAKNEDCGRNLVCFAATEAMRSGLGVSFLYDRLLPYLTPGTCVSPSDLAAAAIKADEADSAAAAADRERRTAARRAQIPLCIREYQTMPLTEWRAKWLGLCQEELNTQLDAQPQSTILP